MNGSVRQVPSPAYEIGLFPRARSGAAPEVQLRGPVTSPEASKRDYKYKQV